MRSPLLPVLVAGALSFSLLGPVSASAEPEVTPDPRPAPSAVAADEADAALEQVEDLVSGAAGSAPDPGAGPDATLALAELAGSRSDLSARDHRRAEELLARPTAGDGFNDGLLEYTVAEAEPVCGEAVCVHYVRESADAPDLTDADADEVPDFVEQVLETAEQIHATYLGAGYLPPDPDRGRGGNDLVDIYLGDLGQRRQPIYGYCTSDQPVKRNGTGNYWAYCAVDNDFAEFNGSPEDNLKVTLAHEYFHAVQFAYELDEDVWVMEATATWAEDEVFDDIDDNRQYLPAGQLRQPGVPLNSGAGLEVYGNWIFFRHLTERFPASEGEMPVIVRDLWNLLSARAGAPDQSSTEGLRRVLARRGTPFATQYGRFAAANRRPATHYEEGRFYPASPVTRRRLAPNDRRTVRTRQDHLTHRAYRFTPVRTRALRWRLRLDVDMPRRATSPVARLLVYRTGGGVRDTAIRLPRNGNRTVRVPFSTRRVKRIELVVVNASRRAAHDGQLTTVRARTFRR